MNKFEFVHLQRAFFSCFLLMLLTVGGAVSRSYALQPWPQPSITYLDRPIYFEMGSTELSPNAVNLIRLIAGEMKQDEFQSAIFRVCSFTDSAGSASLNMELAERRAELVQVALQSHGIPITQLPIVIYGEHRPIPGIPSDDPRQRRVQIELQR